mmetsp:Transcript_18773/g.49117  ORF Transcript_18773/g.49117 Transcript_18773/m.49117 type:complete len:771 (-) Transcript_18773:83-2395(-)
MTRPRSMSLLSLCFLCLATGLALRPAAAVPEASFPTGSGSGNRPAVIAGIAFQLALDLAFPGSSDLTNVTTLFTRVSWDGQIIKEDNRSLYDDDGFVISSVRLSDLIVEATGNQPLTVELAYTPDFAVASSQEYTVWVITGFVSILTPLFVIIVAVLSQEVLWALWTGLFIAASIVAQGDVLDGFLRTMDNYMVNSLGNVDHAYVIIFSWFLAGLVAVIQKSGGGHGIADVICKRVNTRRGMQLSVFVLGFVIFFDDYANTLILGNTMRGVSDAFFVSREKLAFIVDATTAPIASIAPISSWIGFEVGLIDDQLATLSGMGYEDSLQEAKLTSGYNIFLESIVSRFYPILMLMLQLSLILTKRDMGPMLKAERRARDQKLVNSPDAKEDETALDETLEPDADTPRLWWNSAAPIIVTLVIVFMSLLITGYNNTVADGMPVNASNVFGNGDAYGALLWGAFVGSIFCWFLVRFQYHHKGKLYNQWQHWIKFKPVPVDEDGKGPRPILTFKQSLAVWVEGIKGLTTPVLVLIMAWAIGQAVQDVSCDLFFASALSGGVDPRMLPTLTFLIAALISFCTGTSWGTMSIMFPLAVPATWIATGDREIFILVIAGILAGAVFGDHATAISDTTILSSMATKCDLRHHVITQIPYALYAALISILLGTIPSAYAYDSWVGLLLGLIFVAISPIFIAERVDHPERKMDPMSRGVEWFKVTVLKKEPAEVVIPEDDSEMEEYTDFWSYWGAKIGRKAPTYATPDNSNPSKPIQSAGSV